MGIQRRTPAGSDKIYLIRTPLQGPHPPPTLVLVPKWPHIPPALIIDCYFFSSSLARAFDWDKRERTTGLQSRPAPTGNAMCRSYSNMQRRLIFSPALQLEWKTDRLNLGRTLDLGAPPMAAPTQPLLGCVATNKHIEHPTWRRSLTLLHRHLCL